jgi:hypothetical protein
MSKASNASTKIGLVKEVTFGTTPATPVLISQRFASANFSPSKGELTDDSKTGTRQRAYTQTGNEAVAGSLSGPFSHDNYDTLLESVFYNTFASNVLKFGTTPQSLTIEVAQDDISVYQQVSGVIVNGFQLEAPVDGLANISFDMMALNHDLLGTSLDSTYTAQPYRPAFTHCGGTISEGGSSIAYVNSVSLSVSNNLSPAYVWGGCTTDDLIPGTVDVTGNIDVFFTSAALMNKFLNSTASSLSFTLSDGTHTMQFNLPNIRYTGAEAPVEAGSGQRIVSLPFRALFDATAASTVVITRSA